QRLSSVLSPRSVPGSECGRPSQGASRLRCATAHPCGNSPAELAALVEPAENFATSRAARLAHVARALRVRPGTATGQTLRLQGRSEKRRGGGIMTSQQVKVTVYSKPACVQCDATYRALDKKGIEYTVVDI